MKNQSSNISCYSPFSLPDVGLGVGVKEPELLALREVDLAVAAPDEGRVEVGGDAGEPLGDFFRMPGLRHLIFEFPVLGSCMGGKC